MADPVLSQAEVDALVKGVSEGTVKTKPVDPETAGVRACDLTSQARMVRGNMPALESINERFGRHCRVTLSAVLRKPVEVTPEPVQAIPFGEFVKNTSLSGSLHLVKMEPLRGQILLMLEHNATSLLLDHLFGGRGQAAFKTEGREFTPIEQRFIRKIADKILADLQLAWVQVHPVKFEWMRSETNLQPAMVAAPTDVAIVVSFKLEIEGRSGLVRLCIPYPTLEPIADKLYGGGAADQPEADRGWAERFKNQLGTCYVTLGAELGSTRLTIRDVLQLKTNDVIVLDKNVESDVLLRVEGRPKYLGRFGLYRSSPAFQVTSIIREPKEDPYGD
jgi:flagellar motor switch protein FliM